MKRKDKARVNVFEVELNDRTYILNIKRKEVSNLNAYECMSFEKIGEDDLVPVKRFSLLYDDKTKTYGAWTGNCTRDEDRLFREQIANSLNEGNLKAVI